MNFEKVAMTAPPQPKHSVYLSVYFRHSDIICISANYIILFMLKKHCAVICSEQKVNSWWSVPQDAAKSALGWFHLDYKGLASLLHMKAVFDLSDRSSVRFSPKFPNNTRKTTNR